MSPLDRAAASVRVSLPQSVAAALVLTSPLWAVLAAKFGGLL